MNDARLQMLERLAEDEALIGDLGGEAAEQLRAWAIQTAEAEARRTDIDDATVAVRIRAIRTATRVAASNDGDIEVAQNHLATILATPSATLAIRTTPLANEVLKPTPLPWWARLNPFRKQG
jgi:hypothetical protein